MVYFVNEKFKELLWSSFLFLLFVRGFYDVGKAT